MKIAGKALPKRLTDFAGVARVAVPRISMPRALGGCTEITSSTAKTTRGLRMTLRHFWFRPSKYPTCRSSSHPFGWSRRYASSAAVKVMVSPFGPGFSETQS
jgi:hypothetical protein